MMPEPSLSALAAILQPFVTSVFRLVPRLHAERQAGQTPFTQLIPILDGLQTETLDRIRGGDNDSGWWQRLFDRFGQQYVAPEFLRKPALQEWLAEETVASDLKLLASGRIMSSAQDEVTTRNRLAQSYSDRTGEALHLADGPIDVVVAILVAGYIEAIPADQHGLAGMVQAGFSQTVASIERVEQSLSSLTDPITRQAHTEHAAKELDRNLMLRAFNPAKSRSNLRELQGRLDSGDLVAADSRVKYDVRYWLARLCAGDAETLDVAKDCRARLRNDDPVKDFSIIDALIAETDGDPDRAIRILRDRDDPDLRANLFGVLARSRGASAALDMFADRVSAADARLFTAVGWRTWACCMAEVAKWQEAAEGLAGIDGIWSAALALAFFEGVINAQLLLPVERRSLTYDPQLFLGITPNQGERAEVAHGRATACFEFASSGLQDVADAGLERFVADWRRWLRLMDPRDDNVQETHNEIREDLESDSPDVNLVPFACVFGVSFNREPFRQYLAGRRKLGGLDENELRAECLDFWNSMIFGDMSSREFIVYLESSQASLAGVMPDEFLRNMHIDALVRDNQTERARAILMETGSDFNEMEAIRLSALIDAREGLDPRKDLERAYRKSGDVIDLHNLIQCLKQADDRETLLPLLEELVGRQRTVANARDLVVCLGSRPFFNHRKIVEFLDCNSDLFKQSPDLRSAKAWALFHTGRLSDAKELNDQLLSGPEAANALALDINIAVASGDWERLPAIAEREWPRRNSHSAEMLLQLAHIASNQGQSPDRALALVRMAADKAPDDTRALTAAFDLHFRLGRDEAADPSWLKRALERSSVNDGPVWSVDFRTVVTKWMPEGRERLAEIEKRWLAGEIPTGIAASLFNVALTHLLVRMPQSSSEKTDRRGSALVPVVFAGRPPVELKENWAVGLDITTILVLHYLDLLEPVFDVLHHIKLAPDVMHCLFQEQDRVRFHQPSRVRDGQQVRTLCNRRRLRVVDEFGEPPESIGVEVGRELAVLLHAARKDGGRVVCVHPIHRPDSLMEKDADTAEWNDLIVSTPDLCRLLHQRGSIDTETHDRAQMFLRRQRQVDHGNTEHSILNRPIYLDGLALSYLQSAEVLEPIAAAGLDLRIHPDVLGHMDEIVRSGESGDELVTEIDGIRHVLRNAVESGKASYLPRMVDPEDSVLNRDDQFTATQSLLAAAADCDALCVDDRFVNSKEHFKIAEDSECTVPIACVLDLLRCLVGRGRITPERHWAVRHKLRAGGYVVIPSEVDELVYWLQAAAVENDQLVEGAELRAIRHSTVRTTALGSTNPAEMFALSAVAPSTCISVIRALWNDESMTVESASVLSDWIWRYLVVAAVGDHRHIERESRTGWIRESMLQRVSLVLLPLDVGSLDGRVGYADWVEGSVLQPLRPANADLIEEMLVSLCNMIIGKGSEAGIFGNVFLTQLPKSPRQYLLTRYPDRARRWGFETRRIFGLEADVSIVDQDLFAAAKHAFSGAGAKLVRSTEGGEISVDLDPEDGNIVIVPCGGGANGRKKMPELAILSPNPETRIAALGSILDRFGPTAPDLNRILSDLECREPDEQELTAVFREAAQGVAAVQGALLRKIQFGHPIGAGDILPQDIAYYEKFIGPAPETRDPDQYVHDVLIPYRRALLDQDLNRGLDICCLGALRDDLCPGQWTVQFDDDAVWEALSTCDANGSPFTLLGALDVALFRQGDERFREFAERAVVKLCDDEFGLPEGVDIYRLFWTFTQFACNCISLVENVSKQPGFWKRMCAWIQAQFVARAMLRAPASVPIDSLDDWCRSNMALVGAYGEFADSREEPMSLFTGQLSPGDLRSEVLGRLVALRSRHEGEGRSILRPEELDRALERARERGDWLKCFFPGPLEGRRRPIGPAPEDLKKALAETGPDVAAPESWNGIANASHLYELGEPELTPSRETVMGMEHSLEDEEVRTHLFSLELASVVAKTNRDTPLADAVADAATRIAGRTSNENDIWMILQICLQSAAAYKEHGAWFDWLEERLARIANCLPGPPNKCLPILLEHLDAIEMVLPIDSWFHCRARAIASAGAELRP